MYEIIESIWCVLDFGYRVNKVYLKCISVCKRVVKERSNMP